MDQMQQHTQGLREAAGAHFVGFVLGVLCGYTKRDEKLPVEQDTHDLTWFVRPHDSGSVDALVWSLPPVGWMGPWLPKGFTGQWGGVMCGLGWVWNSLVADIWRGLGRVEGAGWTLSGQ